MTNQWSQDGNQIVFRWIEIGRNAASTSEWANASGTNGSYLEPLPDFASHSPFGGAIWFTPHLNNPFPEWR